MMEYDDDRKLARRIGRLRRHARWILIGTALGGLAALVISLILPKTYRATTYLLVSDSKIAPVTQVQGWSYAMPTFVPFVENDELIAKAIRQFHLDQAPYSLTPESFRRRNYLDVSIPKATRLLEVTVEFPDPRLAASLANFLAQTAVEYNNQMNVSDTEATQSFLKQRLDQSSAHMEEAATARLRVREKARIEDREKELTIRLGQKEQISNQLEQLRLTLAQNLDRAKSLRAALRDEPRTYQLKKSITADRSLERASEKLGLDSQGLLSTTEETLNTTNDELRRQLAETSASVAGAQAGIKAATTRLAEIDAEINQLLAITTRLRNEIDQADHDNALAREAYEAASRDYRNASVTVSAKSQDMKQVSPALIPERPARPKTVLNTLLGLLASFALLTTTALAFESLREMQPEVLRFMPEEETVDLHRT
ncbi:MAG: GumC family protein [Terriglobia bacterium]